MRMRDMKWQKRQKQNLISDQNPMAACLLKNIKQLVNVRADAKPLYGKELAELPVIAGAYLITEGKEIAACGSMLSLSDDHKNLPSEQYDCSGRLVMPCWCDSHTHTVFAGSRENEFVDRIRGLSYAEIHARGGGILRTVEQVGEATEDQLFQTAWKRLEAMSRLGTGAVEIKSGYGLTLPNELKMLRVIRKLRQKSSLTIRSTFLGAHTFPVAYRENHEGYIREIIEEMLPVVAGEKLADYIDVFCEKGFFDPEQTERIIRAGLRYGLRPKLHCNQLNSIGGVQTGIKMNAVSLDHLEKITAKDLESLSGSGWKGICTLLPTAANFLGMPLPEARKLVDAGCAIALASDYNPGSSPSGNMNQVISMSCIQMNLLPEEAINAATINAAFAMEQGHNCGSVGAGKKANLILTHPVPSIAFLPYAFGTNHIDKVMIGGQFIS
jgi:imidazolonepropionase